MYEVIELELRAVEGCVIRAGKGKERSRREIIGEEEKKQTGPQECS